ncbi:hypothetical protein [Flagellimonas flava]|uniref:Uncharacterized protein n=1 Tax=Flagellimonas flava TaxID=570519 RepID=A0A1M5QAE9_9FLAO|nr:hypothetical protein [Allomuricauda flava]SHH10709.1 hypothetical protein SAMN04488116_3569 [Allomuricauda flava]
MKTQLTFVILGLLMVTSLKAQIKIGENPQTLDPNSVLELESSSRVLVITRMTTVQMESISPLRGAMVYNTDTECVHFYDGTQWINPCDRPDEQTFTTDPIINDNATIEITETGSNFNFEVGMIRGENIVPTSVNGQIHIQPESITGGQIQDGSVTFDKLGSGTSSGELLQWNGAQWVLVDQSALTITEVDGVIGNEVTGPADASLIRSGTGDALSPFLLDVNVGGIDTPELADNAVTSIKIANGEVSTDDLANDAVTNIKMANNAVGTDELVDDSVTADKINVNIAGTGLNQAADGSLEVNNSTISPDWTNISSIPADIDDGDDDTTYTPGAGLDLTGTTFSVDNPALTPDWANIVNIPPDIDDGDDDTTYTAGAGITLTGTTFSVDNAGVAPDWTSITNIPADIDDGDDDTTYTAGAGLNLVGTVFSVNNAVLAPDWTNITSIPADIDDGDDDTTYTAGAGLSLVGTVFSVNNAVLAPDWTNITSIPADIDDGDDDTTYTAGAGLNLVGTAFSVNNAALAPDWTNITSIPADIDDGDDDTTYAAGAGLTLTGTTFSVDNLAGEVTGPTSATVIANDAVSLAKLANGTTAGQIMEWNGTDWFLSQQLKDQVAAGTGTAGAYTIANPAIATTSVIQLTVEQNTPGNPIWIQLTNVAAGSFSVQIYEFIAGVPTAINANWHYTVTAP